jgi:glutathione peroxidase
MNFRIFRNMTLFTTALTLLGCGVHKRPDAAQSTVSFYDLRATTLFGEEVTFSEFRGKKVLIVNTASKCGFTPQYEGLEALHQQHAGQLVVIGFPANDFMKQEPGSNEEIAAFCQKNYGVSFMMSEKVSVKGDDMDPVFRWLTSKEQNGWNSREPKWNFYKYLVDENGELLAVFPSRTKPDDQRLISLLQ